MKGAHHVFDGLPMPTETMPKEASTQRKTEKPDYMDPYVLHYLHWVDRLTTTEMAELLGVTQGTICYWMRKNGIDRRGMSEAHELYPKIPFPGDPVEEVSMLGLCRSDIHVNKFHKDGKVFKCSTSTAHPAMMELVRDVFGKYGHYHKYPYFDRRLKQYKFGVYVLVDGESFMVLLKKTTEVPKGDLFWAFLANYAVGEAHWETVGTNDHKNIQFRFRLRTTNPELLKQIKERLEEEGFHPNFRLARKAGTVDKRGVRLTKDFYGVFLDRRDEVVALVEKLLPYTKHKEKIERMTLILEIKDEMYWENVRDRVMALRRKIREERDECMKRAEEEYKRRHGGKDWIGVHSPSNTD